jgi:uncharacterized protein YdhG (YjbR/CyaY superfamily)
MPPATIDDYLAGVPDDKRRALGQLREQIQAAAPDATETIAYGVPGFRLGGRYLVGFGATRTSCSFYTGRAPIAACADELEGYRVHQGTINFPSDQPLPSDLVAKLMRVRIAERTPG